MSLRLGRFMSFLGDLKQSTLVKNVASVVSGTVLAQVIVFGFSPLLTRLYGPEEFGIQGIFLALVSVLSPAVAFRYPMALVMAKGNVDADLLSKISLVLAFLFVAVLSIGILVAHRPVALLIGAESLGLLIWLLPLALLCIVLQDLADFHAARLGAFRLVAKVTVAQALITNTTRAVIGLAAPVASTLVVVTTFSPLVPAILLRRGLRKKMHQSRARLSWSEAVAVLRAYRDFPLYRMPTDVLNAASQSVPVIMLATLFSPQTAGFYVLTRSVLNLPSNIIGSAIGNVLYARFAELSHEVKPLTPIIVRSTIGLLLLGPPLIAAAWFAPSVFAFTFGEEWREAGSYAQWMSLWIAVAIANVPAVRVAPVINCQRLLLGANIVMLMARVAAVAAVSYAAGDALHAVAWFSIVSAVSNGAIIVLLIYSARRYDRSNSRSLAS